MAHSTVECNRVFSNGTTDIGYVQLTLFQEFSSQRYCYCLFDSRCSLSAIECGWCCGCWWCCYGGCCCNGCDSQCCFGYFVHNSTYLTVLVLWFWAERRKKKRAKNAHNKIAMSMDLRKLFDCFVGFFLLLTLFPIFVALFFLTDSINFHTHLYACLELQDASHLDACQCKFKGIFSYKFELRNFELLLISYNFDSSSSHHSPAQISIIPSLYTCSIIQPEKTDHNRSALHFRYYSWTLTICLNSTLFVCSSILVLSFASRIFFLSLFWICFWISFKTES